MFYTFGGSILSVSNANISAVDLGTNSTSAVGGNPTLTITVPAGALILVVTAASGTLYNNGTVADSVNGAYTHLINGPNNGSPISFGGGQIFYFRASAALSNATLTFTKAQSVGGGMCAFYATDPNGSIGPPDPAVSASATGSANNIALVSGAPTKTNEFFVAATTGIGNSYTQDAGHGWNAPFGIFTGNVGAGGGHLVNPGLSPINYDPVVNNGDWGAFVVGFFTPESA